MIYHNLTPPSPEEIEVSIFGPGRGECVVLHLGQNNWIIVDSCINRETREPIALEYLKKFNISPSTAVKLIAVTHWHDDHIQGASKLLKECEKATFVCSAAFLPSEFITFINAFHNRSLITNSGVDEFAEIIKTLWDEYQGRRPQATRLSFAMADRLLFNTQSPFSMKIYALAPSDAAVTLALNSFRELFPKPNTPKRRAVALSPNDVSVVFWVTVGEFNILLGGDLGIGENDSLGWRAIVKSKNRPQSKALIVKVPHHGSKSAYYKPMWEEMTVVNPIALVTPFSSGIKPLPSERDIKRLKKHTNQLYCTNEPKGWKPAKRDSTSEKFISSIIISRRKIEGPMGHVCVRLNHGKNPQIFCFPPARKL